MVYGLNTFRERFRSFSDNYVIIGGTACDLMLSGTAIPPRATEDIDMIVVVETLNDDFVRTFCANSGMNVPLVADCNVPPATQCNVPPQKWLR